MTDIRSPTPRLRGPRGLAAAGKRLVWSALRHTPVQLQEWVIASRVGSDAVGDPMALRFVSPDDVGLMISRAKSGDHSPGSVVDGDWDRRAYPFETNEVYDLFAEHFRDGRPWEETAKYKEHVERLERGDRLGLLDTPEQTVEAYRAYLAYWDGVYRDIERNGYRTQRELSRADDFCGRPASAGGEINVYVGRDGRFICRSGKHRLSIVKILGLETIPVRVMVRHAEWQTLRERVAAADPDDDAFWRSVPLDHPDLQDVLPARRAVATVG